LEGSRTVSHTKKHHKWFKKSAVNTKDSLSLITRLDVNIIRSPTYVQLGEVLHTLEFCNKLGDQREWIFVFDYKYIEVSITLHQVKRSILFPDKKH